MMAMAAGPDARLELSLGQDVCPVFIDATQLERALLNLVINARDAMPGGGVLTVALGRGGAEGPVSRHAVLEVRDTGTGMTPEIRGRIFEPFFSTKGEKGTGLGLPIVWRTVTEAGGRIEVDSEPGKGTVFRLLLPGIADPLDEKAIPGRSPQLGAAAS
jgi:signal transduction histidine kinase